VSKVGGVKAPQLPQSPFLWPRTVVSLTVELGCRAISLSVAGAESSLLTPSLAPRKDGAPIYMSFSPNTGPTMDVNIARAASRLPKIKIPTLRHK